MQWSANQPLIVAGESDDVLQSSNDPLTVLRMIEHSAIPRWAGFLSYDLGRFFEVLPTRARDDLNLPLIVMRPMVGDFKFRDRSYSTVEQANFATRSTFTRDAYLAAVRKCLDYIAAGDIFQVNLSQRFTAPLRRPPVEIFNHLQTHFPAQYAAYLDFSDFQLISNSPELFLKIDRRPDGKRRIINRPIKGTRPRREGMELKLLNSEKDKAELAMIVDLQRNDLGRICEVGSVRVINARQIEAHPTVYHGVATIEGILRPEVTVTDILRATFPCGSVTGCPKIRAMEIIDELEPVRRSPYCGAIGWIAPDGTMELSVAIRTMIVQAGQVHIAVGGGIVADSDPEAEYEETLVKARAMFDAAEVEDNGPQMNADERR